MIVWLLVAPLVLWLLVSCAAGTLVNPILLVAGSVINVYRVRQQRRLS